VNDRAARTRAAVWPRWSLVLILCAVVAGGWRLWSGRKPPASVASGTIAASHPRPGARATPPRLQPARQPVGIEDHLAAIRDKLGPFATPDEIMAVLHTVALSDGGLAVELADALGQTDEEKAAWVNDLATQWAVRQPQQVWDWLSRQPPTRIRDLAAGIVPEVIIGTIAKGDPNLLLRNLDGLIRAGESAVGLAPVVAAHLGLEALAANNGNGAELARKAVETWAHDPERPPIGESAYLTTAVAMSQTAPQYAGDWLRSMPPSEERDTALVEFPAHWSRTQPRDALAWLEKNLPASLQMRALDRTFGEWVERNSAEASEWLASVLARTSGNPDTDRLVVLLITLGSETRSNPATALQWTGLISDPETRRTQEEKVVLRWGHQDRSAAIDYIRKSPTISPERKPALLETIASPGYLETAD
jgi:hypothetical protein